MKWFFGIVLCTLTYSFSQAQTYNLDHYLEIARANSPLLKDLKNQVALSQLDSLRLKAGYKTQVTANTGGLYAPVVRGVGYASAITNVHTLNALLGVNQSIVSKGYVSAQLQSIALQRDSIINSSNVSEQDLKKAIIGQYITAYGSLQQMLFSQQVVDLLNKEEDILKRLTRANVYKQSDYLTFLVTLKQQQLQLLQARQQYKNDYSTLNYIAGILDTGMVTLDAPGIQKTLPPTDLNSSIYYQKFRLDSLRLLNSRKLIGFAYQPKTNVFADGGFNSDFETQVYKNFGASVGFSLSIPIYDGGQRKLQYKRLALEEETRQSYKAFFDVQYRQQVAQLSQQINDNENLFGQINDQIKYSESLIKADTEQLQTGDLKIADLILAINNYLTVKNLKTQTEVNRLQLINQLNYWNK